jgi:hypothetical protein
MQQQCRRSWKRKHRTKLSLPWKLVENPVWVPVSSFCKIFIPSHVFDAHNAETGRSRPLIAWLYGQLYWRRPRLTHRHQVVILDLFSQATLWVQSGNMRNTRKHQETPGNQQLPPQLGQKPWPKGPCAE